MFAGPEPSIVDLTLYTDALVIHGSVRTLQRRITDILSMAEPRFLVLEDLTIDEHGSRGRPTRAEYAQVNLDSVLFAIADVPVEPRAELRLAKTPERALISVPPFKVAGMIHLLYEEDIRLALGELTGSFIPVTNATYWSEQLGEARKQAAVVAVNHHRAQILTPFQDADPWAGLAPTPAETTRGSLGPAEQI
jgi:hypothetical protein